MVFNIILKPKRGFFCDTVQFYFYVTKHCIHFIILLFNTELLLDIK